MTFTKMFSIFLKVCVVLYADDVMTNGKHLSKSHYSEGLHTHSAVHKMIQRIFFLSSHLVFQKYSAIVVIRI